MRDAERLTKFFRDRNCLGIARLVDHLAEGVRSGNPCLEIGSSSWVDNERVLDEITLVMRKYGFSHLLAYHVVCDCGEHSEWHKHLYIGGRIPPLDWLTLFSTNIGNVSPAALDLFDRGCGGFVEMIEAGGEEIVDVEAWLRKLEQQPQKPSANCSHRRS